MVNFGAGEEEIIYCYGRKALFDHLDRMVPLKSFGDVVESIPAATIILIEESGLDAASNEGADVGPFFTVNLKRFIGIVVGESCCARGQLGNGEGGLALKSYGGLIA